MSLSRTVFASEFQMAGAVQQNARIAIVVLVTVGTAPEWPIVVTDCGRPLYPGVGDDGHRRLSVYRMIVGIFDNLL